MNGTNKEMQLNKQIGKTQIIINGKTIWTDPNQTILQACEKIGLYIPRFCYNEALSIAGNCRMCLVEIEKSPKLMPACAIKISKDMKIYTKTNLVKKTRESILEFLLINHPLDCPICDQGGECDLQDQALVYGSDRGRFYEYKRSVQDKNAGPLIKTIMTRCIHCTRCIRYATEIAGIEVYGTTGRGKNMEVGTYISNLFNSEISGNVIDLCPVGALTSKPYAFTVRPWELKSIETIDLFDALGSNIRIDIRGSELMRVLPKINNKINQQWISDKTRFAHDGLKCQRLHFPLISNKIYISSLKNIQERKQYNDINMNTMNSKFLIISWQKAFEHIITNIKLLLEKDSRNANKIGGIIGNFVDQETIITFKKIFNQLGLNNLYTEQTLALINNQIQINFDFRSNYLTNFTFNELDILPSNAQEKYDIDTILLIGTNIRFEASMLNVRLRQLLLKKSSKNNKNHIDIIYLGNSLNFIYKTKQIGNSVENLYSIFQGKSLNTIKILKSFNPLFLISYFTIERPDGKTINFMLQSIIKRWNKINQYEFNLLNFINNKIIDETIKLQFIYRKLHTYSKKNKHFILFTNIEMKNEKSKNYLNSKNTKINILHTNASIPGSLDLGFGSLKPIENNIISKKNTFNEYIYPFFQQNFKLLYLLGADLNITKWIQKENVNKPFIIYQGHHGCNAAKLADIILPSTTFIEKKGTYVNTQGMIQQTQIVLNTDYINNIHDDWKILQNLAQNLNLLGIKYLSRISQFHFLPLINNSFLNFVHSPFFNNFVLNKNLNKKMHKEKEQQWIFNKILINYFGFKCNQMKENEKRDEEKSITTNQLETKIHWSLIHNFKETFVNIAPFLNTTLNQPNFNTNQLIVNENRNKNVLNNETIISLKLDQKNSNIYHVFYRTHILYDRDNFYLSDIITKSSKTMGKCSITFNSNYSNFLN
jgi:NADH dehydrogenase (ubiquinone) Fe-S protein 1